MRNIFKNNRKLKSVSWKSAPWGRMYRHKYMHTYIYYVYILTKLTESNAKHWRNIIGICCGIVFVPSSVYLKLFIEYLPTIIRLPNWLRKDMWNWTKANSISRLVIVFIFVFHTFYFPARIYYLCVKRSATFGTCSATFRKSFKNRFKLFMLMTLSSWTSAQRVR